MAVIVCTRCGKEINRPPSLVKDISKYMCDSCFRSSGVNSRVQDWSAYRKINRLAKLYLDGD